MTSRRDTEHNNRAMNFVPGGRGFGADKSAGGYYGAAHPQSMDYLDVSGRQDAAAKAKTKTGLEQNRTAVTQHLLARPEYAHMTDANGNLMNPYQAQAVQTGGPTTIDQGELDKRLAGVGSLSTPQSVNAGQQYGNAVNDLNTMRGQAFSAGPSDWAKAAGAQANLQTQQGLSQASQQNATNQAQAQSDLAMTGGVDTGARERLAASGGRDQFAANQNLYANNQSQQLGITAQDAQMKQQQQMGLVGMGQQLDQYGTGLQRNNVSAGQNAEQFNIGNRMAGANMWYGAEGANAGYQNQVGLANADRQQQVNLYNSGVQQQDIRGGNDFAQSAWGTQGQVLGAQATAEAQAASQKKGGFFSKLF